MTSTINGESNWQQDAWDQNRIDLQAVISEFLHERYCALLGSCPGGCVADAQDLISSIQLEAWRDEEDAGRT